MILTRLWRGLKAFRPWRFSLRTLFVVPTAGSVLLATGRRLALSACSIQVRLRAIFLMLTVVSVYLGCHRRLVETRHALVARIEAEGGSVTSREKVIRTFSTSKRSVGWVRKMMGDVEVGYVILPATAAADLSDQIEQWLPEATAYRLRPFGITGGPEGSPPILHADPRGNNFPYP